jgi:NTP pyrophosphatase (non-canonical NTP hydrolase)
MAELVEEMRVAEDKYGPYTSAHEAYGVLAEEVSELLDAIRANKSESVRREAIQIASVAFRLAYSCRTHLNFQRRSGFPWQ